MQNDNIFLEEKVKNAIFDDLDAIYIADNTRNAYERVKGTEFWDKHLGTGGSLKEMYAALFMQKKNEENNSNGKYEIFMDELFFEKKRYQGKIVLKDKESHRDFMMYMIRLSDTKAVIAIRNNEDNSTSDRVEIEKIDVIQESYLFSMVVDLKKNICINSNTTEISADRQDYMNILYSDWRMKISNMFMEEDKSVFLRMSSPEHVINTLEEKQNFKVELQMLNLQGDYIWVRLSFNRMKGFCRENPRFVYTVQDIHQDMLRLLNQQGIIKAVEEQNEKLQMADKAKSSFISNMSHEIRTPINAVLGMNDMIIRECKDEKILSYAYDIKNASKILLCIVNDILDYSKIESGKMEIIPVEYYMVSLVSDVCNLIELKMKKKSLEFHLQIDENLPSRLYGDELRITQVLVNILTNAVKYTEKGSVTFRIKKTLTADGAFALFVSVEDTGIGMKEEEMGKLFSAFERLDTTRNCKVEGTGLGMSIVVRLLEQMNSKLEVFSVYGKGSTFSFVLPQKIVDETPVGDYETARKKLKEQIRRENEPLVAPDAKLLIVDDTKMNLKVAQALLKPTRVQVTTAGSGAECLELLKKEKFDIVFLDHLMPEMDGLETLEKIKGLSEEICSIPVIALTANVISGARDMYIGKGFDDFLEKPMVFEKIEKILKKYLPDEKKMHPEREDH